MIEAVCCKRTDLRELSDHLGTIQPVAACRFELNMASYVKAKEK